MFSGVGTGCEALNVLMIAACVWNGGAVNEETYREERCLPAVVVFYRKIKQGKLCSSNSEWVFHSGLVEHLDEDFK